MLELWVAWSVIWSTSCCLALQLQLCLLCSTICHLAGSASCCLAMSPLRPDCPSLPLLQIWMNVSSLSPWLLDFHTVRFSGSSGCFLFLNCPSFGCAGKHSVSTYTSILAGSQSIASFNNPCSTPLCLPHSTLVENHCFRTWDSGGPFGCV